jgi:hypothetical protein
MLGADMTDRTKLAAMLKEFEEIPALEPLEPTFMEISGYPHLENVCSNILSFFLVADGCHALGDVLLRALFLALDLPVDGIHFTNVRVERETSTELRQRIDLVIETDQHVIGIENKVYSGVNNDLEHYASHIRSRAAKLGKEAVLALLTLRVTKDLCPQQAAVCHTITYERWFQRIQELLGSYALDCDQRYLVYLLDFMKTMSRLGKGATMNTEVLEFLKNNETAVRNLMVQVSTVRAEFRSQVGKLREMVPFEEIPGAKQWIWTGAEGAISITLVHDVPYFGDRRLVAEASISLSGWSIFLWTRNSGPENLGEWLSARGISRLRMTDDGGVIYQEYPHGTPLPELASAVTELLQMLSSQPSSCPGLEGSHY